LVSLSFVCFIFILLCFICFHFVLYFNHRTCISAGGQLVPEGTCRSVYVLTWV
jgi:hypothetical protein